MRIFSKVRKVQIFKMLYFRIKTAQIFGPSLLFRKKRILSDLSGYIKFIYGDYRAVKVSLPIDPFKGHEHNCHLLA